MNRRYILIAALVLGACIVGPAQALQYIEPTSPLGGTSAAPLNGSSSTQRKLGSLIIGSGSSPSSLCLNTDTVSSDPSVCITSWSQLHGNFVTLSQTAIPISQQLSDYKVSSTQTSDIGFARIQADPTKSQYYSLILEANGSGAQSATALYASDGGLSTNYAAQFNGSVYLGDGTSGSAKKFCLNGAFALDTNTSSATYGKGCISSWSQLAAFVPSQNFVFLQTPNQTPTPQYGNIAINGSAIMATDTTAGVVIGAPVAGTSVTVTCGDGLCNGSESGVAGNANYCAVDCDRIPPGNIVLGTPNLDTTIGRVIFTWTNPSDADFAGVRIIRTIGTPATGPTQTTQTGANAVYTVTKNQTPNNQLTSSGLSSGTIYYFSFYAYDATGNYASGVVQGISTNGTCSNTDCGPTQIFD